MRTSREFLRLTRLAGDVLAGGGSERQRRRALSNLLQTILFMVVLGAVYLWNNSRWAGLEAESESESGGGPASESAKEEGHIVVRDAPQIETREEHLEQERIKIMPPPLYRVDLRDPYTAVAYVDTNPINDAVSDFVGGSLRESGLAGWMPDANCIVASHGGALGEGGASLEDCKMMVISRVDRNVLLDDDEGMQWAASTKQLHLAAVVREPHSQLFNQFHHDKSAICEALGDFFHPGSECVETMAGEAGGFRTRRYDNWQSRSLGSIADLAQFTFIGLHEQPCATLCLFWYTFMDHKNFHERCRSGPLKEKILPPLLQDDGENSLLQGKEGSIGGNSGQEDQQQEDEALRTLMGVVNERDLSLYSWAALEFERRVRVMEASERLSKSLLI